MKKHRERIRWIVKQLEQRIAHIRKLEDDLDHALADWNASKRLPRCSGTLQPRSNGIFYANHSIDQSCPLHGTPRPGSRLRIYIGKKLPKVTAARRAITRHLIEQKAAAVYKELLQELEL